MVFGHCKHIFFRKIYLASNFILHVGIERSDFGSKLRNATGNGTTTYYWNTEIKYNEKYTSTLYGKQL